ncbi:MAG: DUF4157 domain-containing protein [Oscillospiraceae bacterium]
MKKAKSISMGEESENRRNSSQFDYERSEQEADNISRRFKNSGDVKAAMSSQMGIDFSRVHVHQDAASDQETRRLGATAFTRGNDVFMGGEDTLSRAGATENQVLAHELTHTVQQGVASQMGSGVSQAAPTGAVQMWNPFKKVSNHFRRKKEEKAFDRELSGRLARLSAQSSGADTLEAKLSQLSAKNAAQSGGDDDLDSRLARLSAQSSGAKPHRKATKNSSSKRRK